MIYVTTRNLGKQVPFCPPVRPSDHVLQVPLQDNIAIHGHVELLCTRLGKAVSLENRPVDFGDHHNEGDGNQHTSWYGLTESDESGAHHRFGVPGAVAALQVLVPLLHPCNDSGQHLAGHRSNLPTQLFCICSTWTTPARRHPASGPQSGPSGGRACAGPADYLFERGPTCWPLPWR